MHTVGPGIWREVLNITENENNTLYVLKYDEKYWKNLKNDKYTLLDLEYGKITENVEKKKHTCEDLKNEEITEKRENENCTL